MSHGTTSSYTNGCRCEPCRRAMSEYGRLYRTSGRRRAAWEARRARLLGGEVSVQHGRATTYNNWGCRCDLCRRAARQDEARRRARSPEKVKAAAARRRARLLSGEASIKHGTTSAYNNWGCRCDTCCDFRSENRRQYEESRRELRNAYARAHRAEKNESRRRRALEAATAIAIVRKLEEAGVL